MGLPPMALDPTIYFHDNIREMDAFVAAQV